MSVKIEAAKTATQFEAAGSLFLAYAESLGLDLEFQGFSVELTSLPKMYGAPKGAVLLAELNGRYVGVVGLRELSPNIAEMKRMYVLPDYRGLGVGNILTGVILTEAKVLGYGVMRLDSVRSLDAALRLYENAGFKEIEPYRFNPYPDAVFMECAIS